MHTQGEGGVPVPVSDVVTCVWVGRPQYPLPDEQSLHPHGVGVGDDLLQGLNALNLRRTGVNIVLKKLKLSYFIATFIVTRDFSPSFFLQFCVS